MEWHGHSTWCARKTFAQYPLPSLALLRNTTARHYMATEGDNEGSGVTGNDLQLICVRKVGDGG